MILFLASILTASAAPTAATDAFFGAMSELPDPYLPASRFAPPPPGGGGSGARLLDVYRAGDLALLVDDDGEWFAQATDEIISSGGDFTWVLDSMSGAFYNHFGDDYDYLTVLLVSDFGFFFAFYSPIANDVTGIGYDNFAGRETFDTQSNNLDGFIFMNYYGEWYDNPASGRYVFGQEFMHRWGSFVEIDHPDLEPTALLGRDTAHWSYWYDTPNSPMEGNDWTDLGDGTWQVDYASGSTYSDLDLYLMGFVPPEDVGEQTFLQVASEEQARVSREPATTPEYLQEVTQNAGRNIEVAATPIPFSVDDIVAAEGPRVPAAADSERSFKMAFLVLVLADDEVDDTVIGELDTVRRTFEADWEADVLDLADLDTTLGDGDAPTWGDTGGTTVTDSGSTDSGTTDSGPAEDTDPKDGGEEPGGCGCASGGSAPGGAGLIVAALAVGGVLRARRR